MKKLQNCTSVFNRILAVFMLTLLATVTWAQDDKGVDIDVDLKGGHDAMWYNNPILWIIGGAVFILLLVALLRSGSKEGA